MPTVSMTVNGKAVSGTVEGRTLLVQFLREHLGLTGTHVGCDTSQCGCCTIHLNGKGVKSCAVLALSCEGANIVTIEGLATADKLHPMQEAFREHHGLQCGFCTPGILASATQFLRDNRDPSESAVRDMLSGHLCRCTGYTGIVRAILDAAQASATT